MDAQKSMVDRTDVSLSLARHVASNETNGSNLVFSPLSIHVVLSMLAVGSEGPTLDQLLSFLKSESPQRLTSSRMVSAIFAGAQGQGPELLFVNGVRPDRSLSIRESFKQVVESACKVALDQVDFQGNLFEPQVVFQKVLKVLFRIIQPNWTKVLTMKNKRDGLPFLVKKMGFTPGFLGHRLPNTKVRVGQFGVPKFKFCFGFEASNVLKGLGLDLPFSSGGLTRMVDSPLGQDLCVSNIFHKCCIEFNEQGTEAAAASAGAVVTRDLPHGVEFIADHPFLFVIREDVTGVV